jgi:hypothetical protein
MLNRARPLALEERCEFDLEERSRRCV